jgi:hypothetical protein
MLIHNTCLGVTVDIVASKIASFVIGIGLLVPAVRVDSLVLVDTFADMIRSIIEMKLISDATAVRRQCVLEYRRDGGDHDRVVVRRSRERATIFRSVRGKSRLGVSKFSC